MKIGKLFWGVIFIISAAIIALRQFGLFENINLYNLIFVLALTPVFIKSIEKLNFFGIFLPLALVFVVFKEQLGITHLQPMAVFASALFLSIGFTIIFGGFLNKRWSAFHHRHAPEEHINDNTIHCSVSFGAGSKYLHSQNLKKVSISCSFGSMQVYFDNVILSENQAEVFLDCSFSGVELYVPSGWNVINNADVALGSIECRQKNNDALPTLNLTGNVSFGAVEVKYV